MKKIGAEQQHGFDVQNQIRKYLGYRESQQNIHDKYDLPEDQSHIKTVTVTNSANLNPRGSIALSDAYTFLAQPTPYNLLVATCVQTDKTHIEVILLSLYHITADTHAKLLGNLDASDAQRYTDYIKSLSGDKEERRPAGIAWKKANLGGKDGLVSLNQKIDENQCRVQASITTRRLRSVIPPTDCFTVTNIDFQMKTEKLNALPPRFRRALPILDSQLFNHRRRFQQ